MNESLKFMFSLIASVLTKTDAPKTSETIDWNLIFHIAEKHNIASIIAYGIRAGNYEMDSSVREHFKQYLYTHLIITENQTREISGIFEEFEKNKIDYMPLKGTEIRKIYPSPDMRRMADADILVKTDDFSRFDPIMNQLGYTFKVESNHEYVYQKPPFFQVELHKMLIPSYNDDMYEYYRDGWSIANRVGESHRYALSAEDHYVYLFTHLAKHYRDGGIGIKSVIDLWLYKKQYKLDEEYVKKQLLKLNILSFYDHVLHLIRVWFEDEQFDAMVGTMTEFILSGGEYGSLENQTRAKAIQTSQAEEFQKAEKFMYWRIIFPTYDNVKNAYSYVRKYPFLLPVCWIHRWVKGIFSVQKRKRMKMRVESIKGDSLETYHSHMTMVGLDIYNGRKKS